MALRDRFQGEELHLAPQLEGLPDEERLRRFQRARRDAFMRRPGLGTLLTLLPALFTLPGMVLGSWLASHWPEHGRWLPYLLAGIGGYLGSKLTERVRARLIARELEREGPFLL